MKNKNYKIIVTSNGPYLVSGNVPLTKEIIISDKDSYPIKYTETKHYKYKKNYSLCRCGHSKNKPYLNMCTVTIGFIF